MVDSNLGKSTQSKEVVSAGTITTGGHLLPPAQENRREWHYSKYV